MIRTNILAAALAASLLATAASGAPVHACTNMYGPLCTTWSSRGYCSAETHQPSKYHIFMNVFCSCACQALARPGITVSSSSAVASDTTNDGRGRRTAVAHDSADPESELSIHVLSQAQGTGAAGADTRQRRGGAQGAACTNMYGALCTTWSDRGYCSAETHQPSKYHIFMNVFCSCACNALATNTASSTNTDRATADKSH